LDFSTVFLPAEFLLGEQTYLLSVKRVLSEAGADSWVALDESMSSPARNREAATFLLENSTPGLVSPIFPSQQETIFCQMYPKDSFSTIASETLFIDFGRTARCAGERFFGWVSLLEPYESVGSELILGSLC